MAKPQQQIAELQEALHNAEAKIAYLQGMLDGNRLAMRLEVPFTGPEAGIYPPHPRRLDLPLDGPRRAKLIALFDGLAGQGATVGIRSGAESLQVPIQRLGHVVLYLLDRLVFVGPLVRDNKKG